MVFSGFPHKKNHQKYETWQHGPLERPVGTHPVPGSEGFDTSKAARTVEIK